MKHAWSLAWVFCACSFLTTPLAAKPKAADDGKASYVIDFGSLPSGNAKLEVESFSWGMQAGEEQKVESQDVNLVVRSGINSPAFVELLAKQTELKLVTLTLVTTESTNVFSFEGVKLTSYQTGGSSGNFGDSGPLVEQMSLSFKKMTFSFRDREKHSSSTTLDLSGSLKAERRKQADD